MKTSHFAIEGLMLLIPSIFHDSRGMFLETFRLSYYQELLQLDFVQDNMSYSKYGTIRGLHFQKEPHAQAKIVRCAYGEILDVAVDIRKDSGTFGKHISVILSAENQNQFFIPEGFAHGFSVLSSDAIVEYKCSQYYHPESDGGILYGDKALGIDWGIPEDRCIVSDKDLKHPTLIDLNLQEIT